MNNIKKIDIINSRNAVCNLVNFDKFPLEKVKWYPKSILTETCNFKFEIGDNIANECYDKNFSYEEYFNNSEVTSLPVKKYDFSIVIKLHDCISLKYLVIAKIGINYSDIFIPGILFWDTNDMFRQKLCLEAFKFAFLSSLNDVRYKVEDKIDIGLLIIDICEELPIFVKKLVEKEKRNRT